MARARVKARPALRALAERVGILSEYVDQGGTVRPTSDATRVALLAAMGWSAETEERARAALRAFDTSATADVLASSRVVGARDARTLPVRLPVRRGGSGPLRWELEVRDESGASRRSEGVLRAAARTATVPLPPLTPGYYDVELRIRSARGEERSARQRLIVTPRRCATPSDLDAPRARGGGRARAAGAAFGLLANLYTVRSARNWGIGDVTDLRDLVGFAGRIGGAFVGINPLHALGNVGDEISPYSPVSRLYRNVIYLDVTAVPELLESPKAQARLAAAGTRARIARLRAVGDVDYARVHAEKDAVLRELHRTFAACHRGRGTARDVAYARYRAREGGSLIDFATFVALRAHLADADARRRDPRWWPKAYRNPRSPAVARFRAEHAEEVDYHAFLQFELDRQLATVAEHAHTAGLRIGVYQDLALGSSPAGSDPWAFPGLFLRDGISIGAPPDRLRARGAELGTAADRSRRARRRRLPLLDRASPRRLSPCRCAAHRSRHGALPPVLDSRRPSGVGGRIRADAGGRSPRHPRAREHAGRRSRHRRGSRYRARRAAA